ncbi:MAG: T9SS type A sorting domain-containing protein [Methanococcaceae archaeon]
MKTILLLLILAFVLEISAQNRWQKLNGPPGGTISAIISKGDTLIAGTGWDKALIFYSTNGGCSWKKANFKTFFYGGSRISSFVFSNDGGIIAANMKNGFFKTFDMNNWNHIFTNSKEFWSLGKDSNGTLYAGTDDGIIYNSTNDGIDWHFSFQYNPWRIVKFLLGKSNKMFAGAIHGLFFKEPNNTSWSPVNIDTILGYIEPFSDDSGNIYFYSFPYFYKSTDEGENWIYSNVSTFFNGNSMYDIIYNKRIIGGMDDETGWFGNSWGIAVSDDSGKTWRNSNNGLPPKFATAWCLTKSDSNTYLGTESAGVFKSTDFGDSWFPVNNGLNAAITSVISFDNENNLWAACYSNGLYKSTDKGLSWSLKNNGFTSSYLQSFISDDNGILFASTSRGTYRSTDKGEYWSRISDLFFYYMHKDKFNRIYGLSYGDGLFRSTDQGITWTRIDQGFTDGYVFGFAIDSSHNIYTGTFNGTIYKSTDDGLSWSNVYHSGLQGSEINRIAIAPNGTIFASSWDQGILRSTDDGATWELKKQDYYSPQYYPVNVDKKGVVYCSGSDSKFYSSEDNGETWNEITENLTLTTVNDMIIDKNDTMYLATDESVWRSNPDYAVDVKEKIKPTLSYSLSQNYPNPFNPTTEIKYSVPVSGFVSLKIYDILGKEISSLVSEQKDAGEYTVTFNGSRYPSGVYFYTIRSGSFTETKKIILLK